MSDFARMEARVEPRSEAARLNDQRLQQVSHFSVTVGKHKRPIVVSVVTYLFNERTADSHFYGTPFEDEVAKLRLALAVHAVLQTL
ncbi:hypothetical protein GQ600_26688 [Phytophthora cactorum]|nr:hypothetical protein GQ600_26688 [Phytophthora cactorum]